MTGNGFPGAWSRTDHIHIVYMIYIYYRYRSSIYCTVCMCVIKRYVCLSTRTRACTRAHSLHRPAPRAARHAIRAPACCRWRYHTPHTPHNNIITVTACPRSASSRHSHTRKLLYNVNVIGNHNHVHVHVVLKTTATATAGYKK